MGKKARRESLEAPQPEGGSNRRPWGLLVVMSVLVVMLLACGGVLAGLGSGLIKGEALEVVAQTMGLQASSADDAQGQEQDQGRMPVVQDEEAPAEPEKYAAEDDTTEPDATEPDATEPDDEEGPEPTTDDEASADDPRAAELALDPNKETDWVSKPDGQKKVYLTFDDGPSKNTEKILDILDEYGVNATFFVTGADSSHVGMIAEAYERGNVIGLHTMTHSYSKLYVSVDAYFADLEAIGEVVKGQIGYVPYLIRFPGGASNSVSANYCEGIMTTLTQEVVARGYQYYDWNVDSGDASGNNVAVETIVQKSCKSGGHSNVVILMHDSSSKGTTVEALPQIIKYYQGQGYEFAVLDRTSYVCHHAVSN